MVTARMIVSSIHLVVAVAIGIASVGADDATAQPRPAAEDFFGVNIQTLVYYLPDRLPQHLDMVRDAGIDTVRFDAAWAAVEPRRPVNGAHRYDWSRFDRVVVELAKRGLRWLPIVDYSTGWTASEPGNFRSAPTDIPAYAAYAGELAARYGRNGSFWRQHPQLPAVPVTDYEIWNEPNYEATAFPPDRYASAYLQARTAIRGSDPDARAWVGGLAPKSDFLSQMIEARPELKAQIDVVGLHPYAAEPRGVISHVVELRAAMDQMGLVDVPIGVTELGWATQGQQPVPHASDVERARHYEDVTNLLARSDCGVTAMYPHTWVTLERGAENAGDWFGIVRPDGTSTATSRAYAGAIARNRRWRKQAGFAGLPLCDRRPVVNVSSRYTKAGSVSRGRRASSARRTGRVRRVPPRSCQRATVTLQRERLAGTRVRFTYRDSRGRVKRSVTRRTNAQGLARHCVIKPRRRGRSLRWRVRVFASRFDLAHVASTSVDMRIR